MAEEVKSVSSLVDKIVTDLKESKSSRFSKGEFQQLVYGVLQDPDFKVEKYVVKGNEILKSEGSVNAEMRKFLDKLLKHAGMAKPEEREAVIQSFSYGVNDINWVIDAIDEAMWIYTECGKNMRVFRDKLRQLSFKRTVRTGKAAGKVSYKKSVVDKEANLAKLADYKVVKTDE